MPTTASGCLRANDSTSPRIRSASASRSHEPAFSARSAICSATPPGPLCSSRSFSAVERSALRAVRPICSPACVERWSTCSRSRERPRPRPAAPSPAPALWRLGRLRTTGSRSSLLLSEGVDGSGAAATHRWGPEAAARSGHAPRWPGRSADGRGCRFERRSATRSARGPRLEQARSGVGERTCRTRASQLYSPQPSAPSR